MRRLGLIVSAMLAIIWFDTTKFENAAAQDNTFITIGLFAIYLFQAYLMLSLTVYFLDEKD